MAKTTKQNSIVLEIPFNEPTGSETMPRHINLYLTLEQREVVRSLYAALTPPSTSQLSNGKYVVSYTDAVRWLLEKIGDAIRQERTKRAKAARSEKAE